MYYTSFFFLRQDLFLKKLISFWKNFGRIKKGKLEKLAAEPK